MLFQILILLSVYISYVHPSSLPQLPDRFTAIVEANIIQKNKTYIMEEWYDAYANKAKRVFYRGDLIMTTYEDFSNGKDQLWHYKTTHDDTSNAISCTLEAYSQHTQTFGPNDQTQTGHLVSSAKWFQFGSNYTETYLGNNFAVRGITAEAWTRNVTFSQSYGSPTITMNMSFELTYYFSVQNWSWFASSQHRIPLRVDLVGERITYNDTSVSVYNFHHYYDYVQFLANNLTLTQELKFDIPDFYEQCNVTKYCNVYNTSDTCKLTKGPPLPTIPKAFISTWEWSENDELWTYARGTGVQELYYDYNNNREHVVSRWVSGYYENAYHQLDLLDTHGEGQRWTWIGDGIGSTALTTDDEIKNCMMTGFLYNYTGFDFAIPVSNRHIVSPSRSMIFNDNDPGVSSEIWMGYTTIRGIPAQKWKANFNIVVNGGETSLWLIYPIASNQRIILNGSVYWYFSYNWTFMYAPNEKTIPLATELIGIYSLYNYSDVLNDYVEILNRPINTVSHVINWISGTPDESYFKPPIYWRKYCSIDEEYCNKENHEEHTDEDVCDKGLDLPTLPEHKYYTVLEGNDIENKTSHVIKIWWDYDNNELRSEYYNNDNIIVTFDDFNEDRRWTWMHKINDIDNITFCKVESYKETSKSRAYSEENINIGHVKTASELWQFGENYNITYLGNNFNIRGINARSWHSQHNNTILWNGTYETNINTETIFYFADNNNWNYYKGIETSNIPLSIIYKGTWENAQNSNYSGEFNIEYHISSFFSGPDAFDKSEMEFVFEDWYSKCNVKSYCKIYPNNKLCSDSKGPQMPKLPLQWYAMLEATFKSIDANGNDMYSGTSLFEEWYNYNENKAHITWHNGPNWNDDTMHQLDILNVNQKWIWSGNGNNNEIKQCQLTPNILNFTGLDVFITESNGHVSKPSTWFRWNDTEHSTVAIWNGYTTFRGIPAQKWKSFWSEYDEVPSSPFQKTYAIQFNAYTTYYWSDSDWNIVTSDWNDSIPLGITVEGTYTLYNYSELTGKYDILWTSNSFESSYNYVIFNTEKQQDEENNYFEIPLQWKKCNITLYCDKYPNREPCTGKITRNTINNKDKDENNGLSAGYIVLMFVLFFIGLLIGVIIDRYLTRKRKDQGFQGFQNTHTNQNEKQIDATL